MLTSEIECCINSDPLLREGVIGVFAADRIPSSFKRGGIIVNTDTADKSGTHWCAMYLSSDDGKAEFFDSYGEPPTVYSDYFMRTIKRNSSTYTYNRKRLQNDTSNVCGQYCLFYLFHRLRGVPLKTIVQTFQYYPNNDYYVYNFIKQMFSSCIPFLSSSI